MWPVLIAAWDSNITVASENDLPSYDREDEKILENANPLKDPDGRIFSEPIWHYVILQIILGASQYFGINVVEISNG